MTFLDELPLPRRIFVSAALFVFWLLLVGTAVATPIEFARSWREGVKMLGGFGCTLGLCRMLSEAGSGSMWPAPRTIRAAWRTLTGASPVEY